MRVLFLTNIPSPYRVDFFNELGKYCDLTVLYERMNASDRNINWKASECKNFEEIYLKGINFGKESALCISVLKYLKKDIYDIIVVGGYSTPTGMIAIEYLRHKGIPFIMNVDGGFIKNDNKLKFTIKQHFIKSANYWLSTSDCSTEYLMYYGASPNNIFKYNFTSLKKEDMLNSPISEEEKSLLKKELNIKQDKVIISIGQFIKRKGFDTLIKSCKYIDKSIGVYIIGGEETSEYTNLVKDLNLENIYFRGFCVKDELKKFYKIADIFVFPTREDIWGLVINEAMAFGLPIITTDKCVAGLELVKESNGRIVPIDSEEELGKSIMSIIENDEVIKNMSSESLDIIKDYTIENMARRHIDVFKFILGDNYEK